MMNRKKIFTAFLVMIAASLAFSQAVTFCPSISAFTSTAPICGGGCAVLNASVIPVNQTTTYSVQSIPYVPFSYTGGTAVSVGTDDVWSNVINLGFNFCYFGNTYSQCILGSNGQLSFSLSPPLPGGYDNWSISTPIPSLNDMPGNTICAVFRDIDPSFGGNMRYYFTGTAPCRALVIYWSNIPLYSNPGSCSGKPNSTFQLVLYENTNFIDVYVQNSTACTNWNGGAGIIGIQNKTGTVAYFPPSRNYPTAWTATNEAWRFVPTGPQSYTVTWNGPSGVIGTGLTQTVCPGSTTTYTAQMDVVSCSGVNSTYTSAVTVSVAPNPPPVLSLGNVTQYTCGVTTNSADINWSSGTPSYTVNWLPPAAITGSTSTTYSVTGMSVGVNTITVLDALGCSSTTTINVTPAPPVSSFTISAPNGTVAGCSPSTLPLNAVNTNTSLSNMSYTWTSTTSTTTGSSINGSGTTTYTISGIDSVANSCLTSVIFSISQSTAAPGVTVNPISQTLTCNGAPKTFTAITTSTTNLVGNWYDGGGNVVVGPSGTPLIISCNTPGTYTATFCSTINGCCTSQTVSVASNAVIPTITITPSTTNGFTINCTHPCVVMSINSSGTLSPVGYSWTPLANPSASTTPLNGGYTVCIPGQYEAAFHDGNFCRVTTTVNIFIDTIRPSPFSNTNLPSNSYTLNCFTPTLTATALTNPMLAPTNYSWTLPPNLIVSSNTVGVQLSNIVSSSSPTSYTVSAMGANGCVGKAKVNFWKDVFVPPYSVVFTPTAITCSNPCVALTGVSSNTTPVSFTFTSPPPTQTATAAGALMCIPGAYTMTYMNALNGCTGIATNSVQLNTTLPGTVALSPVILPCGQTTTIISAGTTTTSSTYSYTWKAPPLAGMSCPGGINCNTTSVNMPGVYFVSITNTVNGCSTTNSVLVSAGSLTAGITADPADGFAPLSVNFNNTSTIGSLASGTVTSVWYYGNGITYTVSGASSSYSATGLPGSTTVYQAAGSYTVYLIVTQNTGTASCIGTASTVINVDIPSELTVPNVFTPNGDGVNDTFFLQTANLTSITVTIFDRWGVKLYDVTSETGNISWDGKNFSNKDVPAGTYFYFLKATGKDFKTFEQKGTISLFR